MAARDFAPDAASTIRYSIVVHCVKLLAKAVGVCATISKEKARAEIALLTVPRTQNREKNARMVPSTSRRVNNAIHRLFANMVFGRKIAQSVLQHYFASTGIGIAIVNCANLKRSVSTSAGHTSAQCAQKRPV